MSQKKTIITNIALFDGYELHPALKHVSIEGSQISDVSPGEEKEFDQNAEIIDGSGCTLLPGLIDSHVHVSSAENLDNLAAAGVTTALDMACFPAEKLNSVRELSRGLGPNSRPRPQMLSAGTPATSPNSIAHSKIPGMPAEALLASPDQADAFVANRLAEDDADYIKLVADVPGPSQEILDALVQAARKAGKKTVAHAAYLQPFRMAVDCGADCVTHVPTDSVLEAECAQKLAQGAGRFAVPTLCISKAMVEAAKNPSGPLAASMKRFPGRKFEHSIDSVRVLRNAGVPILAGTDANSSMFAPVKHGESLIEELEHLETAGLDRVEVLRSATSLPAKHWGLEDRGVIQVGKRADLILVRGQPGENLGSLRNLELICINGIVAKI